MSKPHPWYAHVLRWMLYAALVSLLTAQSCERPPPSLPDNPFCPENSYTVMGEIRNAYSEVRGAASLGAAYSAILQGEQSTNRRSSVQVLFGQSYCTGTIIGPRTVLTAAHCGYGATTEHRLSFGDYGTETFTATRHTYHPDYQAWIDYSNGTLADTFTTSMGGATRYDAATGKEYGAGLPVTRREGGAQDADLVEALEGRKADIMLLHFDADLPGPYPKGIYDHTDELQYAFCKGALAQGFGQHEGSGLQLRETKYIVTSVADPKYLRSAAADLPEGEHSGRICFGDSGSCLVVDVNGVQFCAGVTSTTMSSDCLAGGTHVRIAYFSAWIFETATGPIFAAAG